MAHTVLLQNDVPNLFYMKTGLCQNRYMELLVAIKKAKDCGFITFDVPFREYDYSVYYRP
jgi:small subunit ribosomal protein S18b